MTKVKKFERPAGLVIDNQDRLIVTDICGRLQVYVKDNDWVDPVSRVETSHLGKLAEA